MTGSQDPHTPHQHQHPTVGQTPSAPTIGGGGSSGSREEISIKKRRKGKRRSDQPVYAQRRRKNLLIIAGIGIPLLVLGLVAFFVHRSLGAYDSEDFAEELARKIGATTGCHVQIEGLEIQPKVFRAGKVTFAGGANSALESLVLRDISGSLDPRGWLTKDWEVFILNADEGELLLRVPDTSVPPAPRTSGSTGTTNLLSDGPLRSLAINSVSIGELTIDHPGVFEAVASSAQASRVGKTWDIRLVSSGATLQIEGLPEAKTGTLRGILKNGSLIDIEECPLINESGNDVGSLAGSFNVSDPAASVLEGNLSDVPIDTILPKGASLAQWADGTVDLTARFSSPHGAPEGTPANLLGLFQVRGLRLVRWPPLSRLASATGDRRLDDVSFDRFLEGDFTMGGGELRLHFAQGGAANLMEITGHTVARLNDPGAPVFGELQLGIPKIILDHIEQGRPPFFGSPSPNGTCWADFRLSGTVAKPEDDLAGRLQGFFLSGTPGNTGSSASTPSTLSEEEAQQSYAEAFRAITH